VKHRGQRRDAVDHRGVDHLAAAGAGALDEGGQDAGGEIQAAAAEIGDQVERNTGSRSAGRSGAARRPSTGN